MRRARVALAATAATTPSSNSTVVVAIEAYTGLKPLVSTCSTRQSSQEDPILSAAASTGVSSRLRAVSDASGLRSLCLSALRTWGSTERLALAEHTATVGVCDKRAVAVYHIGDFLLTRTYLREHFANEPEILTAAISTGACASRLVASVM